MLHLVHPSEEGQGTRKRRPRTPVLTQPEKVRFRAVLKNLRRAYGTWTCLASVMGVASNSIQNIAHGKSPATPSMILRAARAAGTTVEALLAPLTAANACPTCGRRGEA